MTGYNQPHTYLNEIVDFVRSLLGRDIFVVVWRERLVGLRHRPIDGVNNELKVGPTSASDFKDLKRGSKGRCEGEGDNHEW